MDRQTNGEGATDDSSSMINTGLHKLCRHLDHCLLDAGGFAHDPTATSHNHTPL